MDQHAHEAHELRQLRRLPRPSSSSTTTGENPKPGRRVVNPEQIDEDVKALRRGMLATEAQECDRARLRRSYSLAQEYKSYERYE